MRTSRFPALAAFAVLIAFGLAAPKSNAQQVELNPGYIAGTIGVSGEILNASYVNASGPNGASASTSISGSGSYSLTVNVASGTTASFSVYAYAYTNSYQNYMQFPSQTVTVSPGATSTANFSLTPAYVNANVSVAGGTLSYAYIYASGNGYSQGYMNSSGTAQFPVFPASNIQLYGTAYLTNGAQVSLGSQTISLEQGNSANVNWSVNALSASGAITGNVQLNGVNPSLVYVYASGPIFKYQTLNGNGSYSFSDLPGGTYYLSAYAYYNNGSSYLYFPDSAFNPGRQATIGNGTTNVNIGADAAFISGHINLTGSKSNADTNSMQIYGQGVYQTQSQGASGYTQVNNQTGAYSFVATSGGWVLDMPVFVSFYNPSPANYLQSNLYIYDYQQQAQPLTASAGQTVSKDFSYATGTIALTVRIGGGALLNNPSLSGSCYKTGVNNQTQWQYYFNSYGNQQNVSEAQITFVGLEGTCSVNAYAYVNGSNTQFGQLTINVVPGSIQVVDIGGPSLAMQFPAAGYTTSNSSVTVTGTAMDDVSVASVFVNGQAAALSPGSGVPSVSFSANVALNPGANQISTVATDGTGKQGTDTRTVYRDSGPPVIVLLTPADGFVTTDASVSISGTATDDVEVKSASINGNAIAFASSANPSDPREVTFTATVGLVNGDNFITVVVKDETPTQSASKTVKVTKSIMQNQTITFAALQDRTYGDAPVTLAATASSGLAVTYAASGQCTVLGSALTLTGAGNCSVTASQAGNSQYNSATDVTRSFAIANAIPVAANDAYNTNEDTTLTIGAPGVLGNDSDIDSPALTAVLVTAPLHGSLTLNPDGSFVYTPVAEYNGPDSFSYKANDGLADSNVATVTIIVNAVNDPPVVIPQSVTTDEDTPLPITLHAMDVDSATLSFSIVSPPGHGGLGVVGAPACVPSGSGGTTCTATVTYTPALNFNGNDSFVFKSSDGAADSNVATVFIGVNSVDDKPVAASQSIATVEDTPKTITLSGMDIDTASLTFSITGGPAHGSLGAVSAPNCTPDGAGGATCTASVTYTPAGNYNGPDIFTFTVSDGTMTGDAANVNINVTAANDPPVAADQAMTTAEDTAVTITLSATDIDSTALTFGIVTGPVAGSLSALDPVVCTVDGSGGATCTANVTYTPAPNYNGPDSFTFKTGDGSAESNFALVAIAVMPVNDPPVAAGQSVTTNEDTAKTITLSATDVDGDALTFAIVGVPAHGSLSAITGTACAGTPSTCTASVTYTPAADYSGPDSFTFKANDGAAESNIATVSINVAPVNDSPVAADQSLTTNEDTAKTITLSATDVDSSTLTFAIVGGPAHGGLSGISGTSCSGSPTTCTVSMTYTPTTNYNGPDSFTFKANDGGLNSNTATVGIAVTAVNDAPVAAGQSVSAIEDTAKTITLSASDIDTTSLTFSIIAGPSHGTLGVIAGTACTTVSNGTSTPGSTCTESVTYTPALNYNGPDGFTFKANDGSLDGNVATVSIMVAAVNDPPANVSVTVAPASINENDSATIAVSFQDVDAGDTHTATISWGDGSPNTTISLGTLTTFTATHQYLDDNPTATAQDVNTVMVNIVDAAGASASGNTSITVKNVAPVITNVNGPSEPLAKGNPTTITVTFTDVGTKDTHTCTIAWDDATTSIGTVTENNGSGTCTASHNYLTSGVYEPSVTITDDDAGSVTITFQYVVIYDTDAGFVSGGGWITSPVGAYPANPGLTGKANFGFVSKYQKGQSVPTGETEFQFNAAGFNFHSTVYDWLVIAGAKAQYKGSGTVNNSGDFGFLLTATDGKVSGGGGVDKFRIKIWKKSDSVIVYDNNLGGSDDIDSANPQAIGGGNITIHK
jgi:hypothetical protein